MRCGHSEFYSASRHFPSLLRKEEEEEKHHTVVYLNLKSRTEIERRFNHNSKYCVSICNYNLYIVPIVILVYIFRKLPNRQPTKQTVHTRHSRDSIFAYGLDGPSGLLCDKWLFSNCMTSHPRLI